MRRGYEDMLARSVARLRGRATGEAMPACVSTFRVISPPLDAFGGGRTQAVKVAFNAGLPIDSGVVTLEAAGDRIVPMLFDQPRLYRDSKPAPEWDVYIKSYRTVGTALELYDDDDAHVATIQVMQPASPRGVAGTRRFDGAGLDRS